MSRLSSSVAERFSLALVLGLDLDVLFLPKYICFGFGKYWFLLSIHVIFLRVFRKPLIPDIVGGKKKEERGPRHL